MRTGRSKITREAQNLLQKSASGSKMLSRPCLRLWNGAKSVFGSRYPGNLGQGADHETFSRVRQEAYTLLSYFFVAGVALAPTGASGMDLGISVTSHPGGTHLQAATVCILKVSPETQDYALYARNIELMRSVTTDSNGHAKFRLGRLHSISGRPGRFRGTITARAYKAGYCADERTEYYGPQENGIWRAHIGFHLKPIPSNTTERSWCQSMSGRRCDFDPQDRIRPAPPGEETFPRDAVQSVPTRREIQPGIQQRRLAPQLDGSGDRALPR